MTPEVIAYVKEKSQELMNAHSCCAEVKAAAQTWIASIGTETFKAQTEEYIKELEADIIPIDGLIGFASSEAGANVFGAEMADKVLKHAKEIKAAGAEYCDCPACAAVAAILEKKAEMLA